MIIRHILPPVLRPVHTLNCSRHFNYVSMADRFVYSAKFATKKMPNIEFEIKPITSEIIPDVAMEGARILTSSEPISASLHFTLEEALKFFTFLCFSNVQKNLGICCYNKTDNEFAAAILNEDFHSPITNPQEIIQAYDENDQEAQKKMEKIVAMYKTFGKEVPDYYKLPDGPMEVIHLIAGITSPKYRNLGLMTRLTRFMIHEHPLIKSARLIVTEASFPGSKVALERNGFKNVAQIHYREFKLATGDKAFPQPDPETIEQGLGPVQIMAYERKSPFEFRY